MRYSNKKRSLRKKSSLEIIISRIISFLKLKKRKALLFLRHITFFSVALFFLLFYSCQEHLEGIDYSLKVGKILCTDGKIVDKEDLEKLGLKPIGIVFYVNKNDKIEGNGYAVTLEDLPQTFKMADTLGVAQGTSSDIESFDGSSNTYSLYSSKDAPSPAAIFLFDYWYYGQSAYIASVAQARLLYSSKDIINPIIKSLGGGELSSKADETWYWTSTEVSGQEENKMWLISFSSGAIHETPKNEAHKIRPIITLWYN